MKLSSISEATRRDFLKRSAGTAASLGTGGIGGVLSKLPGALDVVGAVGKQTAIGDIYHKIMLKYYLPKLWDKTEDEVAQSLAALNPVIKPETLKHISDRDIINGLNDQQPTPENIDALLEIVVGSNKINPDWLRNYGIQIINKLVNKLGPAEMLKRTLEARHFTLPHAIRRLEILQTNSPTIAHVLKNVGITSVKNITPKQFDVLEKLANTEIPAANREHYAKYRQSVEKGTANAAKTRRQQQKLQQKQDQDDISRWENEGGSTGRFEESLNRVLSRIR